MPLKRTLIAASFAALGALSTVTLSAVASPDDLAGSTAAEQQARPESRAKARSKTRSPGARMMAAVGQLDLSAEQRRQLEVLKAEHRPPRRSAEREKISSDLFSGELDRPAAHASLDARYQDRLARAHAQLDRALDVMDILTPEQRAELQVAMKAEAGMR